MDLPSSRPRIAATVAVLALGTGAGLAPVSAAVARDAAGLVPSQPPGSVRLVSARDDGRPGARASTDPRMSDGGRWVTFASKTAFVPRDRNGLEDVYLVDRATGRKTLVSRTAQGGATDGGSDQPDISGDGRFVAFSSFATDIVPGSQPGGVYRWDRRTGETVLVASHAFLPSVSDDGRHVAFDRPGGVVYLADVRTGSEVLVSHDAQDPDRPVTQSWQPRVSGDGRYVAFYSYYDTIVGSGDDNTVRDAFLWDRAVDTSTLVSVTKAGSSADMSSDDPDVSADGRYVAFASMATDLAAGVSKYDLHIYVRDVVEGTTDLVDVDEQGRPATEDDGWLYSGLPAISADGDSVAFVSSSKDLVPSAAATTVDTYVRHLAQETTELASHDPQGQGAGAPSTQVAISGDGQHVAFVTEATDLRGAEQDRPRSQVFLFRSAVSGADPQG